MRTMFVYTVLVGSPAVITVAASPAGAEEGIPEVRQLYRSGEIRSLAAIVERAKQRYPDSRLVEAELKRHRQRLIYEVELIDADGVVRELYFDARTGDPVPGPDEEAEHH